MNVLTANELKVKGISAIDEQGEMGAIVTVHGVKKYVILPIDQYNQMRELELELAIRESRSELIEGNYFSGSIDDHIKRVKDV